VERDRPDTPVSFQRMMLGTDAVAVIVFIPKIEAGHSLHISEVPKARVSLSKFDPALILKISFDHAKAT
jgi:hypothetical protein